MMIAGGRDEAMVWHHIEDWDDAYANGVNIARGENWPDAWLQQAQPYRDGLVGEGRAKLNLSYGPAPRNRFDLFLPEGKPKGLVVFVHGGFWLRLDQSYFSHLAAGSLAHGYAVAMPTYTLSPAISISGIVAEVGLAIGKAAEMIEGPIRLTGHSAGGHLVTRMVCADTPLSGAVHSRIVNTLSLSGLHDLRPMMALQMNANWQLGMEEARAESPALLEPLPDTRLVCWVGAAERSEFIRQNALLANVWTGLGATTLCVEEPDRHHFNVVDGLANPGHALMSTLLTGQA